MMNITDFAGTALRATIEGFESHPISPCFFKPYSGAINVLGRTTSIVTDSLVLGGFTACFALATGWELLKAIGNLVTGNVSNAADNAEQFGIGLYCSGMMLIATIISPVVNVVDLVGGAVNTVRGCISPAENEDESNCTL
jgi:hypothetical protein